MTKKQCNDSNQPFEFDHDYIHHDGPVIGRFLTALRSKHLIGVKSSNDAVIIPPMEFDPNTGEALSKFVDVSDHGTVITWCWVRHPREKHPIRQAFAWALILLDGADTPFVHCVAAKNESEMESGMRVKVRWADKTNGNISDIVCFDPAEND